MKNFVKTILIIIALGTIVIDLNAQLDIVSITVDAPDFNEGEGTLVNSKLPSIIFVTKQCE